jgi:cation transport regulator ChaC
MMDGYCWVFGYGSLVGSGLLSQSLGRAGVERAPASLRGFRRAWNAGMANRHDDPTDKFYVDEDGLRPDVVVAFLGLRTQPTSTVNGVVFRVGSDDLAQLDLRERRYSRVDATHRVSSGAIGRGERVFVYLPTPEATARCLGAAHDDRLVVPQHYFDAVADAFGGLGPEHLARFSASTDDPPRLSPLNRVEPPGVTGPVAPRSRLP